MADELNETEPAQSAVDAGEHIQGAAHSLGISTGLQEAVDYLIKQSGIAYAARRDSQAEFYRKAADELIKLQKERRLYYDTSLAPANQRAFDRLEAIDNSMALAPTT